MPESPVSADVTTELSAITVATFVFLVVVNGTTEAIKVTPRHLRLVNKLETTSLTSVHTVKSSISASAKVLLFNTSLIMAMDIMSMVTADRNSPCESTLEFVPAQ